MLTLVNVGVLSLTAAAPIEIAATPAARRSELLPREPHSGSNPALAILTILAVANLVSIPRGWTGEEVEKMGVVWRGNATSVSSHDSLPELSDYPAAFTWADVNGTNYLTPSLNQHIPQ